MRPDRSGRPRGPHPRPGRLRWQLGIFQHHPERHQLRIEQKCGSGLNVCSINLSVGTLKTYSSPCGGGSSGGGGRSKEDEWEADVHAALAEAKAAGIFVAAASGNSAETGGLSSPACAAAAASVGAVYDQGGMGASGWGYPQICADTITYSKKVVCFSNSASYLSLLAPGTWVIAGGPSMTGTSQVGWGGWWVGGWVGWLVEYLVLFVMVVLGVGCGACPVFSHQPSNLLFTPSHAIDCITNRQPPTWPARRRC
jgi:hypothetical protein